MGKTIAIVIFAILAVALLVVVFQLRGEYASCKEQLASSQAQVAAPCKERMKVYKVVPECHLEDANGCALAEIHVPPSTQIMWINDTQDQVAIYFPQGSMVEGESVTIQPGDSSVTNTTAVGFGGAPQSLRMRCGDKEPPPVNPVNCPPPPAPCP